MLYDKSLWIKIYELSKRLLHIYKRCIPLTVFTMSKVHEKSAFQRTRTKLTHIVSKSYTLPTIWNCICYNLCYIMINIPTDFYNINKEKLREIWNTLLSLQSIVLINLSSPSAPVRAWFSQTNPPLVVLDLI